MHQLGHFSCLAVLQQAQAGSGQGHSLQLESGIPHGQKLGHFHVWSGELPGRLCDKEASEHLEQPTVFNQETFPSLPCAIEGVCACMYMCVCVCLCVFMYVYMYMYMRVCVCMTATHTFMHMYTYINTTCTCVWGVKVCVCCMCTVPWCVRF